MKFSNKRIIFLVLTFLMCGIFCFSSCNPRSLPFVKKIIIENENLTTKQTEEAIKNSSVLQELDNMCRQIPIPQDFKFIWKGGLDDQKISLASHYYSETDFEQVKSFYEQYFIKNSWQNIRELKSFPRIIEFRNINYRVVIQYSGMGDRVNYAIYCEKLSTIK